MKSGPVQHLEPSLDRNLPIRVLPEETADNAQPDRFARARRVRQDSRRVSRSHNSAHEPPIQGLKLSIVTTLIGQIKRLMGADRLRENSRCADAFRIGAEPGQPARIGGTPLGDVRCAFVNRRKLRHAQGQFGLPKIRLERERPGEMGSRLRDPGLAAERYAAIVMSHERARIDSERRLVLRDRLVAPSKRAENIAKIVAYAGTVPTQRDRALRM